MTKRLWVLLIAVVIVAMAGFACTPIGYIQDPGARIVEFPDTRLKWEINSALHKWRGEPITVAELAEIHSLKASDRITDLTGIEFLLNLTHLDLGNNRIRDITPLSSLTKLERLDLSHNRTS